MKINQNLFCFFLFIFISCNAERKNKNNNDALPVTALKLATLDGNPVKWEQYTGKTVFVNFWATWCKPCVGEMPSIRNMMEKMKDDNIVFFFATDETPEQVNKFRVKTGFDFHFVRAENMEELNIMALPTTYIFTPGGKLAYREIGYRNWEDKKSIKTVENIIRSK